MNKIVKQWAGRVYGTNTGKLFLEFEEDGTALKGTLRFMDDQFGLVIYQLQGTYDDLIKMTGTVTQAPEGISTGNLDVEAALNSQGHLQGSWKTALGTAGTFVAFPHNTTSNTQPPAVTDTPIIPEQIHTKNIALGAVRLFQEDVIQIFEQVKQDFASGKLVITYNARGSEVSKYADDFLVIAQSLGTLDYLKVMIQEHEAYGINKVVIVELRAYGLNEIKVQGIQETWVVGKAETLATTMKRYESTLVTTYKKFGLSLNQFIFLGMLIVMPSIATWQNRALFTIAILFLLSFLHWLHSSLIPNASIQMATIKATWFSRLWPSLISWLGAVASALVASSLFYWLTKVPPQ